MSDSAAPSASTVDRIFTKIDEQTAMHMRTREDLLEVRGAVRELTSGQERAEKRQTDFEKDVDKRFEIRFKDTDVRLTDLDTRVTSIHEERLAEKAQWRGPEKVIAFLIAAGGVISLAIALKDVILPH